ncbi:MAG: CHAD domain-containing protein [Nitrososphaerales archaeon]
MNSGKNLAKSLSESTDKLDSRLKSFLTRPDLKNVHDVRTSIRRIEASFNLLPKNIRKKKIVSNYLTRTKSLFKSTSPIRDIDIAEGKLRKFETTAGIPDLLKRNEERRAQLLGAAMKVAGTLEKTPIPRIKPSLISESKLSKRRKKIEKKFEDILHDQIAVVLANPKPDALHEFRKNCKMLRYTLELDSNKKKRRLETTLEYLQTTLGNVLDDYTTLGYLAPLGDKAAPIISELNMARDKDYTKFVAILKRSLGATVTKSRSKHIVKA